MDYRHVLTAAFRKYWDLGRTVETVDLDVLPSPEFNSLIDSLESQGYLVKVWVKGCPLRKIPHVVTINKKGILEGAKLSQ